MNRIDEIEELRNINFSNLLLFTRMMSFPLKPCSFSFVISHQYAEPFLRHVVIIP